MLGDLNNVMQIKISDVIVGFFAILIVIKGVIELVGFLGTKMGIQFKWVERRNADHKTLEEINNRLKEVEKVRVEDTEKSNTQDNDLKTDIVNLDARIDQLVQSVEHIKDSVNEITDKSRANEKATIEILYTMIDQKCSYYINTLKGIPSDDIKQFSAMFDAYDGVHGNHGLKSKVDYCLNRLPVLSKTDVDNILNKQ